MSHLSCISPSSLLSLPTIRKFPPRNRPSLLPRISLSLSRCYLSLATEPSPLKEELRSTPSPAEVSRTIMELSAVGTLSALAQDGCPLGVGARFIVDARGAPALCLNEPERFFVAGGKSSFHVGFEQSGYRTPQCTLLGSLNKLNDELLLKRLCTKWENKFGEAVDEDLLYVISVERVLQLEDFNEDAKWISSSEYASAEPDPLRSCAEKIVDEMNSSHAEDVHRLCNIYVDTMFQVKDAKMIWVDRLGFDLYVYSDEGIFAARIPFPREVIDEKGVKSAFNSMSHLAWEVEKNYVDPDFEKVRFLKKVK